MGAQGLLDPLIKSQWVSAANQEVSSSKDVKPATKAQWLRQFLSNLAYSAQSNFLPSLCAAALLFVASNASEAADLFFPPEPRAHSRPIPKTDPERKREIDLDLLIRDIDRSSAISNSPRNRSASGLKESAQRSERSVVSDVLGGLVAAVFGLLIGTVAILRSSIAARIDALFASQSEEIAAEEDSEWSFELSKASAADVRSETEVMRSLKEQLDAQLEVARAMIEREREQAQQPAGKETT